MRDMLIRTNDDIYSLKEIQHLLSQQQSEFQWTGKKFIPKSFQIYKWVDVTDSVQVAIVSKQLIADKSNGAMIRTVSPTNTPIIYANKPSTFLTEVIQLYAANGTPPWPRLLCDDTAVSRVLYQRLFSVIGITYGLGDGSTTFNLPDFRGRFALGVDQSGLVVSNAEKLDILGGQVSQILTLNQLSPHVHSQGTYTADLADNHSHSYHDPGHNHGGSTGSSAYSDGTITMGGPTCGRGNDHGFHSHGISMDRTYIEINNAGSHNHSVVGERGAVGGNNAFSILNPYQTVNYIIYHD
ncbi:unnamed protein product [Rotaria sp. Silwood2]|nr:unnamed protein product [Rotaria sp. Silwood2]CAF4422663.1 unnamed protein product [Rotaria sp. Silwood2]